MAGDVEFRAQLRRYALVLLGMAFVANTIDLANGGSRVISTNFNQIIALMYFLMIFGMIFDVVFSYIAKLVGYEPERKKKRASRKSRLQELEDNEEEDEEFIPFINDKGVNSITASLQSYNILKHSVKEQTDPTNLVRNRFHLLFAWHIVFSFVPYVILFFVYFTSNDLIIRIYFFGVVTVLALLVRHFMTQYVHYSFTRNHNQNLRGKSDVSNIFAIHDQRYMITELICVASFLVITGFYIELFFLISLIFLLQSKKQSSITKIESNATAIYDSDHDVMLYLYNDVSECFYPYFDEEGEKILITTGMASFLHGQFEFTKYYEMEVESFSWYLPKYVRFLINYATPPLIGIIIGLLFLVNFSDRNELGMLFLLISISLFWLMNILIGYFLINRDVEKNIEIFRDIFDKESKLLQEEYPEIWTEYQAELYFNWKHLHSKSCVIYSDPFSSLYGYMTLTPNSYEIFENIKPN